MVLNGKTLVKLRDIINKEAGYKRGPQLIDFFNQLGSNDEYGQGFTSRNQYTDQKLNEINGTEKMKECLETIFNPHNFVGKYDLLDSLLFKFNEFLAYDNLEIVRKGRFIEFKDALEAEPFISEEESKFLDRKIEDISITELQLDSQLTQIISDRLEEIKSCIEAKAPLAVIFLSGSTLEGVLLGVAQQFPKIFNQALRAPKYNGKVKGYSQWKLFEFINVACDTNLLQEDVREFSHVLRDFRNYIHPNKQLSSNFNPTIETAMISFQVLQVAILQLSNSVKLINNY